MAAFVRFNEEVIESLFSYSTTEDKKTGDRRTRMSDACHSQVVRIIDPKKSQNLSILLRALNVTTEEVRTALLEGLFLDLIHTQHTCVCTHIPITLLNLIRQ